MCKSSKFLTALIMILALSLLTVSCKKSQPTTPTNNPAAPTDTAGTETGSNTGTSDSGSSSGSTDTGTGGSTGGGSETTTKEITADAITTAFKNIATYDFTNTTSVINAAVDFANFTPQNGIANLTNTSNSGTIASYSRSTVQFTNIIAQKLNIEGATFKIEAPDSKSSSGLDPLTANVTISLQDTSKYKFTSTIDGYKTEGSDIKISIKFYGKEWKAN